MWADLINKDKVHRVLWCALYMAVTLLLQNTVFAHIALFGVHAMFVPAVVVAVGVFEGGTWGAVFGLIAGYFGAMGYPGTGMLFAVLFAVIGFGAGMLAEYLINNSLLPFLVTCLAAFLLTAFCQMFRLWIFHGASFWRLLAVALGQSVLSLPLAIPYYYISRAFHRRRALRCACQRARPRKDLRHGKTHQTRPRHRARVHPYAARDRVRRRAL